MIELYENLNAIIPMDSLSPNFDGQSRLYKRILIVEDLFPIEYVLLK
jgi:hypothetical protein